MKKQIKYEELIGEGNPIMRFPGLFDASVDEFSQKRFEDASLNDILKKAGMSKGSLYYHFGDKFGLYLCMADRVIQKKIAFFTPIMEENKNSGDFFGTIRGIIRGTIGFMYKDERLHHLLNRILEASDKMKERLISYFHYDYSQGFGPLIRSAIASGQIDSRYSPDLISSMLEIFFSNTHMLLKAEYCTEDIVAIIDQFIDMLQYGLSRK